MAPLLNAPIISAFNFATYGTIKRMLGVDTIQNQNFPVLSHLFAGCITGLGCATINTPLDFVKCRLQVEGMRTN